MAKRSSWLLLFAWAACILAGLLFYSQKQLSGFDPQGVLLHASTEASYGTDIARALQQNGIPSASIIHVSTSKACYCDTLAQPHQQALLAELETDGYRSVELSLEQVPELKSVMTATPALIVIDDEYQLRYLGPYATGYGCFTGKNVVEEVLQYTKTPAYPGAIINADGQGCFCHA